MIKSKLPNVGNSIFSEMTALANSVGAINLSQGFPGFQPDAYLLERLNFHAQNGKNQYASSIGIPELREQLGNLYHCSENEITISTGAAEALFCAISAVVSPGDEVIIIEPAYDLYAPAIQLNGGVPVFVKMSFPDFEIDWDEISDKISFKTKLIIINTPHNPTGKVLKKLDIQCLEEIAQKHPEIYFVSDEVYEYIVYEEIKFLSLRSSKILKDRTFVCNSFAKSMHITGWKVGFCIAPPNLTEEFRKIHQYVTFCVFPPAQYAIADSLEMGYNFGALAAFYQAKRDLLATAILNSPFKVLPCEGTFFLNVGFSQISTLGDKKFSVELTKNLGVASIPTSAFYTDASDKKIIRFCFAKDDKTLLEAAERLSQAGRYF